MKNYFKNWNFMRLLRLSMGIFPVHELERLINENK